VRKLKANGVQSVIVFTSQNQYGSAWWLDESLRTHGDWGPFEKLFRFHLNVFEYPHSFVIEPINFACVGFRDSIGSGSDSHVPRRDSRSRSRSCRLCFHTALSRSITESWSYTTLKFSGFVIPRGSQLSGVFTAPW
jgi:hypothetical protein